MWTETSGHGDKEFKGRSEPWIGGTFPPLQVGSCVGPVWGTLSTGKECEEDDRASSLVLFLLPRHQARGSFRLVWGQSR